MAKRRTLTPKPPETGASLPPPHPPSWFDRLTVWIDRLPGPAWAFYLILGTAVVLAETAIQWSEGAYPIGSFNALHAWTVGNFAYLLFLMHYLDKSAASALVAFSPLLTTARAGALPSPEDQATFARLSYRLTTLPSRPALIATLAGAAFVGIVYVLQTATGAVPSYLAGTAGTPASTASVMAAFVPSNAISMLLAYHTVHQLVLISRIYTQHARINVYQLQPLYALSLPGAYTAIGLILYLYVWFSLATSASQAVGPVEIGLIVFFAAIAGATFALPLLGAHHRLVTEKDRRLVDASLRFEATAARLHSQLDSGRLLQLDPLNKALASLEIEQNALRRIPTWPWQPGAVRGLVAALLLPVAVWAIQLLLGRVLGP
jgi:hypothetical protein